MQNCSTMPHPPYTTHFHESKQRTSMNLNNAHNLHFYSRLLGRKLGMPPRCLMKVILPRIVFLATSLNLTYETVARTTLNPFSEKRGHSTPTSHYGRKQPKIQTAVLGHSLVRSLVRSLRSLPRSWESVILDVSK